MSDARCVCDTRSRAIAFEILHSFIVRVGGCLFYISV